MNAPEPAQQARSDPRRAGQDLQREQNEKNPAGEESVQGKRKLNL